MYGDLTSGMVLITTKSYFTGIRDKNMYRAQQQEQRNEQAAQRKAIEEEARRQKEIEAEKEAERQNSGGVQKSE